MKRIHDMLTNGNVQDAVEALYNLPLAEYPCLIHYCAQNPEFGGWAASKLESILNSTIGRVANGSDKRQFRCVEEARGRLLGNQPTAAILRLTYGAKKRTGRLIRRSVWLSHQMLMNHGLAGLDKIIGACNTGLEDD